MSNLLKKLYEKFTTHQANIILVKMAEGKKMYVVGDSK